MTKEINWEVGQKVWCVIYGAGVVKRIRENEVDYPVLVVFNRNDENVISYTLDGKYQVEGNVTLFPYPIEITKATPKPSIDWSHVDSKFNYLAEDADGVVFLYEKEPFLSLDFWSMQGGKVSAVYMFASYIPGTCDWKDSLVARPVS